MRTIRFLAVLGLVLVSGVKLDARTINTSLFVPDAYASVSHIEMNKANNDLVMYFKNDIFTVSYLNKEGEKVKFEILSEDGEKVFVSKSKEVGIYHNRLSLSTLPSGTYTAMILVGDKAYTTTFSK